MSESASKDDLANALASYMAIRNRRVELQAELRDLRASEGEHLAHVHQRMTAAGQRNIWLARSGEWLVEVSREVQRRPAARELPRLYAEVLGAERAHALTSALEARTRSEMRVHLVHRKTLPRGHSA